MDEEIAALLSSATFRGLHLGDTEAQVRAALGEPTDRGVGPARSIWKYGDVELHFDDENRVWLFHADVGHFGISRADTERMLGGQGIAYGDHPALTFDDQSAIETASGALLVFDERELLFSVSARRRADEA